MTNSPSEATSAENFHARDEKVEIVDRAKRLQLAVREAGGATQVAIRAHMPLSTLSRYLNGRDMKASALVSLAKACGVPVEWLADGHGTTTESVEVRSPSAAPEGAGDTIAIKFFEAEPSAGFGSSPEEWDDGKNIVISRSFLSADLKVNHKTLFLVRIKGDSMEPTLSSGDVILVDYTPENPSPGIYVFLLQGMLLVKRLSVKDPQTFRVVSDNPRHDSFDVPINRVCWGSANVDADLRIIGRVVCRFEVGI